MRALALTLTFVTLPALAAPPAPSTTPATPTMTPASKPPTTSTAAPLAFTFVYVSGEASRDASSSRSTFVVEGGRMTYRTHASGRARMNPGGDRDRELTGIAVDVDAVRAALAAFDATPKNEKLAATTFHETTYREACVTRGKDTRCVGRTNDDRDPKDAEEAAAAALYMTLVRAIPLPKL